MFLKAINEYEIDNQEYVLSIVKENFSKLLADGKELNKDNQISNLIMSISINRLLVDKFNKSAFRSNQKDIEKYLDNSSFYTLTDKRVKSLDEENYYQIKKNTISIPMKTEKRDIVFEDEFNISRMNYFIDHINDVCIDDMDLEKYDFYKSQFLYLSLLYFDSVGYDKFKRHEVEELDSYLDQMREGIEKNYFEAFLQNAKNRYYNLNPYGILCPIKEISLIEQYIDEINAHTFSEDGEKLSLEIIQGLRKFIVELKRADIPEEERRDLLSDSDFKGLCSFFDNVREGRIDDEKIIREKMLENLLLDVKNLIEEIRRKRD